MSPDQWQDRVALVTGASSGIGEAVATALADRGMKVAVTARRAARLESLATRLRAEGAEVLALPADARDEAALLAAFDQVRRSWGGVDVLINGAAGTDDPSQLATNYPT